MSRFFYKLSDIDCNCEPPTSSYQELQYLLVSIGDKGDTMVNGFAIQFRTFRGMFIYPRLLGRIPSVHIALLPVSRLRKQQKARRREIVRCEREMAKAASITAPNARAQTQAPPADVPMREQDQQPHQYPSPHAESSPTPEECSQKAKAAARTASDAPNRPKSRKSVPTPCAIRSAISYVTKPNWADGLPEDVIWTVRCEAMKLGISSDQLIKQWTLEAARNICGNGHRQNQPAKPERGEA